MNKKSPVHIATKIVVDVLFYLGILCCLLVPFFVGSLRGAYRYDDSVLLPFQIILFLAGAASVWLLYNLKRMLKSILRGNPFIFKNVQCLRQMSLSCFFIMLIFLVKCIFWFTPATLVVAVVFGIATLCCLTVKDVFKQAVFYKEENDLTV